VDAPSKAPQAPTAHSTKCIDLPTCKIACDEGATEACGSVGEMVFDQKTEPAAPYFERACPETSPVASPPRAIAKGADLRGCYRLALLLDTGRTIAADPARALSLWAGACDLGHAPSCSALANRLSTAMAPDGAKAEALLVRACELDVASCAAAAEAIDAGVAGAPDETKARALLRKACDAGRKEECKTLSDMDDRLTPREIAIYRVLVVSHGQASMPRSPRPRAEARTLAEAAVLALNQGADFDRVADQYDDRRYGRFERRSVRLSLIDTAEHTTRRPQPEFLVKPGQATFFASAFGYHVIYRVR
jgi:hypothetical protein